MSTPHLLWLYAYWPREERSGRLQGEDALLGKASLPRGCPMVLKSLRGPARAFYAKVSCVDPVDMDEWLVTTTTDDVTELYSGIYIANEAMHAELMPVEVLTLQE